MATQPVLPQYTRLLEFYDHPPNAHLTTASHGSSSTAPMAPAATPVAHHLPRRIIEDQNMCQTITMAARSHLAGLTTPPGNLASFHLATQMGLNATTGDELRNIDVFGFAAFYVRCFVETAEGLAAGEIQVVPGQSIGKINANRKIVRQAVDRVIVEVKSVAAFQRHAEEIQNLARANQGNGTEIRFQGTETDGRSMILKLGMHMIARNCSWGVLCDGNEYMVCYLDRLADGADIYHHLVLSGRHATFPAEAPQGTPCLVQVLIALLLGSPSVVQYTAPQSQIGTRYGSRTRSGRARTSTAPKSAGKSASSRVTRSAAKTSEGQKRETGLETRLDGIQLCSLAFPNSGLPDREFALIRVNAQKAEKIMSGVVNDLPETAPHADGAHPLTAGAKTAARLLAFEELGSGICGSVYDGLCVVNGHEDHCAIKVVQHEFAAVPIEVSVYEQLHRKHFIPKFYGAFAGMWVTGPLGAIVMERLEKTFTSYEEMDTEEKRGALACLKQLHRAGFHHGDIAPRNFGARKSGEVVILDFSVTETCQPCKPRAVDACRDVRKLEQTLFGGGDD
ncbi:hypothetical protein PRK78_002804 [Emydomyces testavorans]|uniref:Protein kinase domain-containing protein n=1 Tax=Emydomyces testavorans TaxID=2070801 RepID=A0AAF0DEZ2_9EURO|nr:hypothetical protein PRK78_002804 [Emydomyces testavorans]